MKRIILVLLFSFNMHAHTTQDTQKLHDNQQMTSGIPDFFFNPLEYSSTSITFFLKRVYNHPKYPQEFLALNFIHVTSGINLAEQSEQPRRFIKKMLGLIGQKIQQIYVNPYAYAEMLNQMTHALSIHCNDSEEKRVMIDALNECIGSCLVDDFYELKNNPDQVLNRLSQKLYSLTHEETGDISVRELQHALHYFLARGLMHLIWSPNDQAGSWRMTRTLGRYLEKYADLGLIDSEMLDDLLWTLLKRFGFFVALAGTELEPEFFDAVSTDLQNEQDALWLAPERESYITTKLEYLQGVLMEAELTSRMCSSGLVIPYLR